MSAYTSDGRMVRFLNLTDEERRECLTIHIGRRLNSSLVDQRRKILLQATHVLTERRCRLC